jgi:hypothetical protein
MVEDMVVAAILALEPLQVLSDDAAFTGAQVSGPAAMAESALRTQCAEITRLTAQNEALVWRINCALSVRKEHTWPDERAMDCMVEHLRAALAAAEEKP